MRTSNGLLFLALLFDQSDGQSRLQFGSFCNGIYCEAGSRCEMLERNCFQAPCPPPVPTCIKEDNSCANVQCRSGKTCLVQNGRPVCVVEDRVSSCAGVWCPFGYTCQVRNGQSQCLPQQLTTTCANFPCGTGQTCRLLAGRPVCVNAQTCDGVFCGDGQTCRMMNGGVPICVDDPPPVVTCATLNCPMTGSTCQIQNGRPVCVPTSPCSWQDVCGTHSDWWACASHSCCRWAGQSCLPRLQCSSTPAPCGISLLAALPTTKPPSGPNICMGSDPQLEKKACIDDVVNEQSGANVTKGYQGNFVTNVEPIQRPFYMEGLCPVNVHWHLGAEHLSVGEYDENGRGPNEIGTVRRGFQCKFYDARDAKFTKPYNWKYCKDTKVGQTYEVHWPNSAAGACGTLSQYQTPFADGVFCFADRITETHSQIGVQAQVFTIVNDEQYYYPDLMRGMIVDGDHGADIAKYTGSTTGTSVNNEICSQYAPISWHVDRKCHLISASSFDKMCADMLAQRDDMTKDLSPHGSRELVADFLAANNHHLRG